MIYIGIDPGQKGGIAVINSGELEKYFVMPDSIQAIYYIFESAKAQSEQVTMIAEKAQAMPKQGSVSMFNYGKHYGCFEPFAMAIGIKFVEVNARSWKAKMGLNSDKVNSIRMAEQMFPSVNLIPTPRSRNKHDGMAEAILLAEYGRRMNL